MQTSLTLSAAIGTAIMLVVYGRLKSLDQQLPLFLIIGTLEIVVAVVVMMFSKRFESMILDN